MARPWNSPLDTRIDRRDFMGTTLIGAGASLLAPGCPLHAQELGADWTGPGGIGDYRDANGNTAAIVDSAHRIRDGAYDGALPDVTDTGESYDLIVVGGGFGGLGAAFEFARAHPGGRCLIIDNAPVFGGLAKANEFEVDGHRIAGAQATMNFLLPTTPGERADSYWDDLGLPASPEFASRKGGDPGIVVARSTSGPLYRGEQTATTGYHFGKSGWVRDIWTDNLARAPWSDSFKASLRTYRARKEAGRPDPAEAARLDTMTFADFATRELGADPATLAYITDGMCIPGPQISAYGAQSYPGIGRHAPDTPGAALGDRFMGFPEGNAVIARHFVKAMIPDAVITPLGIASGPGSAIRRDKLERPGAAVRLRAAATAVRVAHDGPPGAADRVAVVYEKGGKLHRVHAAAAVVAAGPWVAKHIVADLPPAQRTALDSFLFAPMIIANVALRNWRFLDKLGFSAARWFGGFGFYASIRQPMKVNGFAAPFHPGKPIVLTIYANFPNAELPLESQGPAGRAELMATSYADYERRIVAQLTRLFASGGFVARRDIAGIALNRWGHAFLTPPPGFFFGSNGAPAPSVLGRAQHGRIAFALAGMEDWLGAAHAGKRAVGQLASALS